MSKHRAPREEAGRDPGRWRIAAILIQIAVWLLGDH